MRFDPDLTAVCRICGRIGDGCWPSDMVMSHDGFECVEHWIGHDRVSAGQVTTSDGDSLDPNYRKPER